MKVFVFFLLVHLTVLPFQNSELSKVRVLYRRSPVNKQEAESFNRWAATIHTGDLPLYLCYKGASTMIQAKYTFSPFEKLRLFNEGRGLVEGAIKKDTMNLEMRFIRYSIQKNVPGVLGYNTRLESDKRFLLQNTKASKDAELKHMIINYLSSVSALNSAELKSLGN